MALYRADASGILTPEEVSALIVQPVTRMALAMQAQVSTVVSTESSEFRIPIVTDDPGAGWVIEGAEIPVSDAEIDELLVLPRKVAGISIISRELANDSSPAAKQVVGDGLARDIAKKVDAAFFGNISGGIAPVGLGGLTGVSAITWPNSGWVDLDPLAAAVSAAEEQGVLLSAWVTSPATALELATVKDEEGSARPLLGDDPTRPTGRTALGIPLYSSPAVAANTVWGIPAQRVMTVVREDAAVEISDQAFFSSDRIAIRATMRVAFGYPHPAAVVKLTKATS